MANDPLNDEVQGELRTRTHLIQLYTSDPDEGPRLISDFHPQGVPIMIIIRPPSCCYFKLNVPHGIVTLEQTWGRFSGMMHPGYYCCYCSNKRIAAMITKNAIQFNCPIEACPTKDNVRVNVDISINFHIGKEETREQDCRKFLYYLGANRLEELLNQELEESIRNFVRTIKVEHVRDIKQELTSQMMNELNQRFNGYGVYIESANVSNVIIPKDLRTALYQATTYDVLLQNQVKFQGIITHLIVCLENVKIKLMNNENITLQTLKRENQKKLLDLNNQLALQEIYLEKEKVKAETDQKLKIINAEKEQSIKLIQAQATKSQAEKKAKKDAEKILAEALSYAESKKIETDAIKQTMISQAETRYHVAELRSDGQIKEADAENAFAANLQNKRKFEQKMKQADNFSKISKQNKMILSGKNADDLLNFFNETGDLSRKLSVTSTERPSTRQDIKTSLEQQKLLNQEKFQEPFFIKIAETSKEKASMRIVKQKKKHESSIESEVNEQNSQATVTSQVNKNFMRQSTISHATRRPTFGRGTVVEAQESDEYSPQHKGSSKILENKIGVIMSEEGEYEKVSQETPDSKAIPQLVKLDINIDSLKNFLEDIQEAVNDHSKSISLLQSDLKKKANEQTMGHYLLKISEGLHKECGERPHAIRLDNEQNNFLADHYQSEDSVFLKRNAEKLQEKLEVIGLNLINLQRFRNQTDDRLDKLEKGITKCFTVDQFREESQNQETRTMKYINDQLGTFQENLNNYKKELTDAITFFEKKVNDNQSETLWRIKDCEELLRSRVSDKYVNDAIKATEEKLNKLLRFSDEKHLERLEKSFKELGNRVITTNQFFNEKFDDLRKLVSTYDQKIAGMATNDKLTSVQTGYRDMKYNFEREMESLQDHIKDTKDKVGELSKKFSNLEQATASFANGGDFTYNAVGVSHFQYNGGNSNTQGTSRNQGHTGQGTADKMKNQATMGKRINSPESKGDSYLKEPSLHFQNSQLQSNSPMSPLMRKRQKSRQELAMTQELEKKVQLFQDMIESLENKIDSLKKQLDLKITAEDVRKLTSDKIGREDLEHIIPSEEINQEKMKYLVRDEIDNMQNKINEMFKQYDNKLIRLRAEVDVHQIQRQLERKANEEQVRNDFSNHEFKISTLDRNIIRMANDFETFQLAINKIHQAIVELQESNRDVLLGKKTNNCLSCGKGGDGAQTVIGKDGRAYKAADVAKTRIYSDDTNIIHNTNYLLDGLNSGVQSNFNQNQSQQQSNIDLQQHVHQSTGHHFNKMRPSHSFYDNENYENQNLPTLHSKKYSSGAQSIAMKQNMPNNPNSQGVNNSFTSGKRKLPFGFQVQNEKKELYKIGAQRGKSSQNMRPSTNRPGDGRPDSAKNNSGGGLYFNTTFDL